MLGLWTYSAHTQFLQGLDLTLGKRSTNRATSPTFNFGFNNTLEAMPFFFKETGFSPHWKSLLIRNLLQNPEQGEAIFNLFYVVSINTTRPEHLNKENYRLLSS